ncbi:nucleotide-binding protein [Candidatus Gracilibacteria bacterium]|nr:nucleotide-binding protein [Candidatus Gracilibacteria bacterium]NJM88633.1 nucleotide-binding protein [Hydrococcus sp. RU_2_2]NJP20624.1 nucleotide-binding protein [Hydrococcus sp. CRU_1_1]
MDKQGLSETKAASNVLIDLYSDNQPVGRVIGSKNLTGITRKGIDVEGTIGIDNNALRIKPLVQPGWGRAGIAYGPYTRANGLAFATFLLNGHNTSQMGYIPESFKKRLLTWFRGSKVERRIRSAVPQYLLSLLTKSPDKKNILRRLLYWYKFTRQKNQLPLISENLAVGWFPNEIPANPLDEGNAFIVHAASHENGELWTRVGSNMLSAFKGLQNLQIYYITILREAGAAYYIASVPNARGLAAYPNMRPIAIEPFNRDATVYAGIYQSVQGEIGFWVDTRVYGTQIHKIPELTTWYGTAVAADSLTGDSLLGDTKAEIGGLWTVCQGHYQKTANGTLAISEHSLGILDTDITSGLVHLILETSDTITTAGIVWRFQDSENFWSFLIGGEKCQLLIQENGIGKSIAISDRWHLEPNTVHSLQVLDDGTTFSLYLNGKLVFDTAFSDTRLQNSTGVGIQSLESNNSSYFRSLEAHPRSIAIPKQLDLGSPWVAEGKQVLVSDNFTSDRVTDLAGTMTTIGDLPWRKEIGTGIVEYTENNSAKVKASAKKHNPGRTAYTVAWENPEFADIQVEITPPGSKRGQGEKGRGGLIFWQDPENYIIINNWLDDWFAGASISSFFTINGFEDLYDAVWTNVGSRVSWGVSHRLRVVFDGLNYTAFVNDEPVLYRSLRDVYPNLAPMTINRVGIVANWEWGNDTGSVFNNFIAKS